VPRPSGSGTQPTIVVAFMVSLLEGLCWERALNRRLRRPDAVRPPDAAGAAYEPRQEKQMATFWG